MDSNVHFCWHQKLWGIFNTWRINSMNGIRKIHINFDNLYDNYKDLPETEIAYDDIEVFMDNDSVLGCMEYSEHKSQLYKLISNYGVKNERQGFEYGFKYAFSLFLEVAGDL